LTARSVLRSKTRSAHERVDEAFSRFDLADRRGYGDFLIGHAAAFMPMEDALTGAGAAELVTDWAMHRRAPLLRADLAQMGLPAPGPVRVPDVQGEAELLGALYVLEGSRLGGAVLRRSVPPTFPASFLNAPQSAGRWTTFVTGLDQLLNTQQRLDAAVCAAVATFACFEQAATLTSIA
jgi:heme oxygenase